MNDDARQVVRQILEDDPVDPKDYALGFETYRQAVDRAFARQGVKVKVKWERYERDWWVMDVRVPLHTSINRVLTEVGLRGPPAVAFPVVDPVVVAGRGHNWKHVRISLNGFDPDRIRKS